MDTEKSDKLVEETPQDPFPQLEGKSQDLWFNLQFDLQSSEMPDIAQISPGIWSPNILYRGSENWLSRFAKDKEDERKSNIRQEVLALFARWLKMQNVRILIGAGASFYVTGFVGSGLFGRVKKLLEGRSSELTLKAILAHASDPDKVGLHFEKFLSQLTAWRSLLEASQWPIDQMLLDIPLKGIRRRQLRITRLSELLLDLERAITVVCNVDLPSSRFSAPDDRHHERNITPHEALIAKLSARDPQQGRTKIFTTNYDTLIEQAMDRLGVMYCDGFTGTVARRFNPAAYDLDLYYPGEVTEGRVRRYDKVLHLYKLHGSINWRRSKFGTAGNPYGIVFDNRPLPREVDLLRGKSGNPASPDLEKVLDKGEGLAILPTSGKYGETLAMPFSHMFRAFSQALREPQTVLMIIGYSGWDDHINQLIEDALTNPSFTCVIIDPNPSSWARRLCRADACGRVYCLGGHWGTFEFFALHVLPDLEVLRTELAIAQTLRDLQKSQNNNIG